jgi:alkylation response protein AidB-like acyl-CoA dehydrogenase
MDFSLTQDQELLARTASDFVNKSSPVARARKLREHEVGWEKRTLAEMAELGWLAIPFGEDVGGLGATFVELALVLEQLGKTLVPEPLVPCIVAGLAIDRAGDAAQKQAFLAPMIEGKSSLALAYAERDCRFDATRPTMTATRTSDGFSLRGEKVWVLNGHAADHLVVTACVDGKLALFVVDAKTQGVTITKLDTFDGRKAAHVRFDDAKLSADRHLQHGAEQALAFVLDYGAACAVAEGVGVSQRALDMTIEYLNTREQFDVKIGTFQALQHRAVDMFIEAQLIRSVGYEVMVKVADSDVKERARAISAAKVQLSTGGKYITRQAIQLHGGVGCTDEHDIGLYFKRMHVLNTLFGDEEFHVARYARTGD